MGDCLSHRMGHRHTPWESEITPSKSVASRLHQFVASYTMHSSVSHTLIASGYHWQGIPTLARINLMITRYDYYRLALLDYLVVTTSKAQ